MEKSNLNRCLSRDEIKQMILYEKRKRKLTYKQIAYAIGRDKVWTAACIHGHATMNEDEVEKLCKYLDIDNIDEFKLTLTEPPMRSAAKGFNGVTTDPTIYRLYEIVNVYGESLKALIHEECGDGIMSAIGMEVNFETKRKDDGEHIVITLDGKFLPYKKW
jgi:cyanate lyase